MNKTLALLKMILPISLVGVLAISFSIVFGHGGETHDSTETVEREAFDTLSLSQTETLDSIYGVIQQEFNALTPVFEKGCFDCHTTKTNFPWYYKVPLVKDMIDDDITEARKHMDMSDGFPFGGHGKPVDDLVAIREVVVDGGMPPMSYRMMHWNANPSESERDSIIVWIERGLASLAAIGVVPTEADSTTVDTNFTVDYACPMHPQITGGPKDNCSLCGAPLEVVKPDSLADSTALQ